MWGKLKGFFEEVQPAGSAPGGGGRGAAPVSAGSPPPLLKKKPNKGQNTVQTVKKRKAQRLVDLPLEQRRKAQVRQALYEQLHRMHNEIVELPKGTERDLLRQEADEFEHLHCLEGFTPGQEESPEALAAALPGMGASSEELEAELAQLRMERDAALA